ncbi:MAG: radical SAM/SPASM domain-containing protein [Desulfovibrionaceae bacterium]
MPRQDDDSPDFRKRESDLKKKWEGVADNVPVNEIQHSYDSPARERQFIRRQFPDPGDFARYQWYREEWYRRAKELDGGPMPLAVTCELVSSCNLQCSMCYTITPEFQNSVVGKQRMLPFSIVRAVIDECVALGVPSILFSWRGESAMYVSRENGETHRFTDVLAYARKAGMLEVTCLTNGRLLREADLEAMVEAEPNWINFSVDGLEDAYNKIRAPRAGLKPGENPFQEVAATIRKVVALRDAAGKTRPQIRTNAIFPSVARNPQAYYDFMRSLGVDWVTINELLDMRGEVLPAEQVVPGWVCQYPFQRLTVAANGVVLPCTGAHNEEPELVLGIYRNSSPKQVKDGDGDWRTVDLPELTLAQAWGCDALEAIRATHRRGERTAITGCRNCRHGMVKNGVTWLPDDWDMDTMQWAGGVWRE